MSDAVILRLNAALEGCYVVEGPLGEGGMVGAERFLAEIRTTANLLHPHILPLHDSGEADGFLFFVSPYIDGETLRDRLDRENPRWARDGKAIIYVDPQGNWLRADVRTRPDFAVTERRRIAGGIGFYTDFDVAPDGRILALHRGRGTSLNAHTMLLVTDWRRGLAGGS